MACTPPNRIDLFLVSAPKLQRFKSQRLQDTNVTKSQTLAFYKSQCFSATEAEGLGLLRMASQILAILLPMCLKKGENAFWDCKRPSEGLARLRLFRYMTHRAHYTKVSQLSTTCLQRPIFAMFFYSACALSPPIGTRKRP